MLTRGASRRLGFSATLSMVAVVGLAACGGGAGQRSSSGQSVNQDIIQSSNQNGSQQSSTNQSGSGGSNSQSSSFSTSEGPVQTYAGTADATLTVRLQKASRLLWSNDKGQTFHLDGAGVSVDSKSGSGEVALSGGRHSLHVHGKVWTVVIRPS